jgi:hypothetical protein
LFPFVSFADGVLSVGFDLFVATASVRLHLNPALSERAATGLLDRFWFSLWLRA